MTRRAFSRFSISGLARVHLLISLAVVAQAFFVATAAAQEERWDPPYPDTTFKPSLVSRSNGPYGEDKGGWTAPLPPGYKERLPVVSVPPLGPKPARHPFRPAERQDGRTITMSISDRGPSSATANPSAEHLLSPAEDHTYSAVSFFNQPNNEDSAARQPEQDATEPPAPRTNTDPAADPDLDIDYETRFGQEPEDYNIQFLRSQAVLLQAGQWQFDYGLSYSLYETNSPALLAPDLVARVNLRQRVLQVPFAVRYGVTDRLQAYINAPVGWSHLEVSSNGLFDINDNGGGIGDTSAGLTYHLREGCYQQSPDIIVTAGATIPTGNPTFPIAGISQASLANGVWAASIQGLAIHRYDPVVVFYGLGYRYQFTKKFLGTPVQLGQQVSYSLGVGFAANDRVTLSAAFLGLFQTELRVDGQGVPGSMQEPLLMRFAMTAYRNGRIIEPFVNIGMTRTAPSAIVGITWTLMGPKDGCH